MIRDLVTFDIRARQDTMCEISTRHAAKRSDSASVYLTWGVGSIMLSGVIRTIAFRGHCMQHSEITAIEVTTFDIESSD